MLGSLKKSRSKMMGMVMAVLLLGFAIVGCNQAAETSVPGATKPASTAQPKKVPDVAALPQGEAGRTDTFEMRVTSVSKATEWTREPSAGMEYIVVAIQVTNISKEEASISASDFGCVQDADGNRASWENYTGIKTDPDTFGGEDIAPGDTFAGSLIFAIPTDMSETELHYTEGYALKPDLRFEISK